MNEKKCAIRMRADSNPKPKEAKAKETEKAPFVPYERTIRFPFSFAHTLHTLIVNFKV